MIISVSDMNQKTETHERVCEKCHSISMEATQGRWRLDKADG